MKKYNTAFPYFPKDDIEEILKDTREMLNGNKMLTMGENVQKFEKDFSAYCQSNYAVATNSCTSALEIALSSLNLTSEDEVIVPVQTFVATGSCVLKSGAKIVFCDVDDDFLLDFEFMKRLINKNTKAVIIVHFAGMISTNIIKIRDYLKEKNIILIEDDAHAHGATFGDLKAGNIGDIGCFSFYSTKIITTGEGGMITTNNQEIYEKCASLRNRGIDINYKGELFINLGSNHRFTEFQGLLGIYQLKRLEEFLEHRNKIANIYKNELSNLIDKGIVRLQVPAQNSRHSYWRFIIFLNNHDRDEIIQKLNGLNIKADAPYFPLLHNQPLFRNIEKENMQNAERLSKAHLSLPIHMLISEDDAKFIIKILIGFFND
ncbi:DegT/DnrJ/EryC1/StrS family aminotransferase [Aliarcobacter butzleri]|uniref:DegT/DnrJ/EryC1/StrS family aminotransferase n=1 Tax=Aliarcobacter butzleri TaxID=28197 RepID=UPI001ED9D01C|nr:DegT/DnrJ/EryC1/StrS family aminotransferase [Aliarcobacter butzleri]MCG3701777.1 DegT/DnrJ/EryC1/StrS family aminotransferase [Aliarcobacter butzleri]MCG3703938.1 DegT/DnrJ/EryC1/StrS family aminotransferase [Aliarcobacter butzleri]